MAEIALISEDLFYENSPVKETTVISKFVPYVLIAQNLHVKPILGDALTIELQEAIKANNLTPEQSALIRVIAPVLSLWAVYQALPFHWAAIVNKGVTIGESENSKAAGIDDIAQIRCWLRDDAQILTRNLVAYLRKCSDSFPAWRAPGTCEQTDAAGSSTFDPGIYIPG